MLSGRGHDGVGIRGRGRVGVGGDDASRLSGFFAVKCRYSKLDQAKNRQAGPNILCEAV